MEYHLTNYTLRLFETLYNPKDFLGAVGRSPARHCKKVDSPTKSVKVDLKRFTKAPSIILGSVGNCQALQLVLKYVLLKVETHFQNCLAEI